MEQPTRAPRKENKWITHVKKFASENGINYSMALKDPRTKALYREEPEILKEKVKSRRVKERVMKPLVKTPPNYSIRELTKKKLEMKKAIIDEENEIKKNARIKRNMMRDSELDRVTKELYEDPEILKKTRRRKERVMKP